MILLYGLLHLSGVQTWLVHRIAINLSGRLDTRVTIKKVDFRFFDQLQLKGLMIEDRKKDTLLYAGTAKVNLTDWFFFKDVIVVNNIGLQDAVINMNRNDSVWNYQFLLDFFASPNNPNNKKKGIQVDIKEAHFKNVLFNKVDNWIGQRMTAALSKLDLSIDKMDIDNKQVTIKDIYLERPLFSQSDYDGNKPVQTNLTDIMAQIPVISAFKWNNSGWVVKLNKLQVFDGRFINNKYTVRAPYTDRFDGQHVDFSGINGTMSEIVFLHDTLQGNIDLRAKERSGLDIKKLQSHLRFTPELMEFSQLNLESNKSKLGNYYAMRYNSFNTDMSSFLHNVTLDANFAESVLSSDDLAIFAPELASMKRVFYLEGTGKGTIDNFTIRNMKIRSGNSFIDGNLSMRGLPDINSTFIDLRANTFQTNYQELVSIIPSLRTVTQPALSKLGSIRYTGNYTGFIRDFVAYGDISTNLGNITADMNMKISEDGNKAAYSGKIKTAGFNLGQFINDKNIGTIALNGRIKGQNFAVNKLNANFSGQINRLDYAGYSYRNIDIDGNYKNKVFSGKASINDPNVKISDLQGEISLSGKELAFNADAKLEYINFQQLGFTNDKVTLSGIFSLNFTGNTIDNFLGTARVYNATLQHDSTRLSFDSLAVKSYIYDGKKSLTVQSNELDAALYGKFSVLELPDAFKLFLNRYYPVYINAGKKPTTNQDFIFNIKTNNIDQYIRLFDPKLDGFNDAEINGSLNLDRSELKVNANVPLFSYEGRQFTNTALKASGNRDTLFSEIRVGDIALSDSMHFPETRLNVASSNGVSVINLKTSASKTLNYAELNASIESLNDGVRIHFFPSEIILNNKRWLLEKDGELALRKNYIDASEVKFVNGEQEIVIATELADVTDDIHLVASLRNVIVEDILPFWVTKPSLKGRLTGKAQLRDYFGKQNIEFQGVADSFSLNDKYIGRININGKVNTSTGLVEYNLATKEKDNDFAIDGFYNFKDSTGNSMNTRITANRLNLNILEPYLATVFSRIDGVAIGAVTIADSKDGMTIIGEVVVDSGSMKVAYTQCRYLLRKQKISFKKDEIDLGIMQIKDTLNNTGAVSGKIQHHFFNDFYFDNVRVETAKMLLLNTTKKDNSQFYGNVIGGATMSIRGPVTNMIMQIDGQPSILDSSHIYLPTGDVAREDSKVDYIEFIQFGSEMDKATASNKSTNILVDMNITANPACKVDVILDEETGDVIKGEGNGKLNIRVGTTEPLSIRGRYELTAGEYTFNFQTLLKKPFILSRGSITWNGDPYLAIIDIDAKYVAERVDISSITSSSNVRSREDIIILSKLTGNLTKPEISFEFLLPENSEWRRDYFTVRRLADFQNDKNEMYKQVASLLLINTFITGDQAFISGGSTYNLAATSIGGILSDFLTKVLNKELERATNGAISTYIDINPSVDLQNTARQLQANVRAGFKIFFSDNLNVLVGGNLDYNNPYLATVNPVTPDINIEWLLNKDGSIKVVGFRKTSTDFTSNQRNRSGVKLSYRRDFNRLGDIFKKRQSR